MRKHILSRYSKSYNTGEVCSYYDEVTQVSYIDKDFKIKVSNISRQTAITEVGGESTDVDEFNLGESTYVTETIESSDQDEFNYICSTKATFTLENSDDDEIYLMETSIETRVIENSDSDEFVC